MKLLKKIARLTQNHKPTSDNDRIMTAYIDDLVDIVGSMSVSPKVFTRWIPNDGKNEPDHLEDVLVYLGDGLVEVARFNDGSFETLEEMDIGDMVLYWRQMVVLPE